VAGGLSSPITVESLSSKVEKTASKVPANFADQVAQRVATAFKVPKDGVQAVMIGPEAICLRVERLPNDVTLHSVPQNEFDLSYRPCPADATIINCIGTAYKPSVMHTPCVAFTIYHTEQQHMKQADFEQLTEGLANRYGFFLSLPVGYNGLTPAEKAPGRLGSVTIEVNHVSVALALAQEIHTQIPVESPYDVNQTMTMTRTTMRRNLDKRLKKKLPGKPPPRGCDSLLKSVRSIPQGDLAAVQELVARAGSAQWAFDDRYRVLVVPVDDELALRENIARMHRNDGEKFCLFMCDDDAGDDLVPEPVFIYHKDGKVTECPFCRQCLVVNLQESLGFFNPNTRVIDSGRLIGGDPIDPIPVQPSEPGDEEEKWPVVPLGGLIWSLMSDKHTLAPLVKAWVSGVQEYTIRKAKHLITYCPNHPAVLLMPPPPSITHKCNVGMCEYICCGICGTWHKMSEPCMSGEIEGTKRCPRCKIPVFKYDGCNRVTCRCGGSFCWKCPPEKRIAYNTANECYSHLAAVHGGYWDK
jgi:hypothetical protein